MATKIALAKNLSLPIDAVTETFALLAKRGAGKSYTASVMVEGMLGAGLQVVILDPMGIWYGLRTLADGKSPGFQIPILGGEHGDIPLESTGGKLVADLIMADKISAVLDVSMFTKGERKRFVADFAERLYRKNREAMHLVLEEADMFAPQKPQAGEQRMLGAIEDLVRRGRSRGIGLSLISQRSAVLNKDVLTQTECLIALRTTAPHDRRAIKDWIDAHADRDEQKVVLDSLPSLPTGTAWFWSPSWLEQLQKVKVKKKTTLDTGATPKAGVKRKAQKTIAEVDLGQLTQKMSATIEKAKADDPKELRARIRELEKAAATPTVVKPGDEVVRSFIEQALDNARKQWTLTFEEQRRVIAELVGDKRRLGEKLEEIGARIGESALDLLDKDQDPADIPEPEHTASLPSISTPQQARKHASKIARSRSLPATQTVPAGTGNAPKLPAGAQRIINTLVVHHPDFMTKAKLGFLAKVSPKSGTFSTYLSKIRIEDLINESDGLIQATDLAVHFYGSTAQPMSRDEMFSFYRSKLPEGARRMLDELDSLNGNAIDKKTLGENASVSPKSGTFSTYLSKLRTLGLLDERDGMLSLCGYLNER